ncbi:hypothetical protein NOV72_01995 [Caballeronia novacaledonica]|uniref:Uncharacterized protein n=1 Tax=Caballeronia novacaledonica TaxID=1544861 RepID=A0A2U3I3S3_9BURK|nr:hypothetical protein [Caballeronia novacaledonica]SPB14763.1 hypothetical protein NOV72_01995 [Caballeronia novacaledonica]
MYMEGYFLISPAIEKIEGPYSKDMVDPETGEPLWVDEEMVVVAPPDYPQLAAGLEIGALYRAVRRPNGSSGFLHGLDSLQEYYDWCEKLVSLVTNGKKLKERPNNEVEWSNQLSGLVEDSEKYPETGGRGPFWELLRYGLRGMTFGPVVCQRLAADFRKWQSAAHALDDSNFSGWYSHIWSTFAMADEAGIVTYGWCWTEDMEPKLGIETLKLFED